jgi:hypothetical protein
VTLHIESKVVSEVAVWILDVIVLCSSKNVFVSVKIDE